MGESFSEYCSNYDLGELLAQWHPTRNAPLEPTMVMPGSAKRV